MSVPADGGTGRPPAIAPAPLATAALLSAIAIVNIVQFPAIERAADVPYEALPDYGTDDLAAITEQHYPASQELFGLHVTLAERAPGATVELGPGVALSTADLVGLGRAAEVTRLPNDDPMELGAVARDHVLDAVVAEGVHLSGPWSLALLDDGGAVRLVAFRDGERTIIADRRLLP